MTPFHLGKYRCQATLVDLFPAHLLDSPCKEDVLGFVAQPRLAVLIDQPALSKV
jgi:hypothetical protein